MGNQISQPEIISAIIRGIEEAHKFYESCSGGEWLWEAPEYLININIAQELKALDGAKFVTLESNVHQMLRNSQIRLYGAPNKKLRHKGRFDLVLWWGGGTPRCAIEVKNQVYSYAQILKDVERIESLVNRNKDNSSFQFGVVAFYTSCVDSPRNISSEIIVNRTQHLLEQAKSHVSKSVQVKMYQGEIHTIGTSSWIAICLTFKL